MTPAKRAFDVALALVLGVALLPLLAVLVLLVLLVDGWPPIHAARRVGQDGRIFLLFKLRTMRPVAPGRDRGVSGGDKSRRITRLGRVLRRSRLDELPQLWNVLRGEMSFVGPRPPLPEYVQAFPELYQSVLACRPGITGLATLVFHRHEEALLAPCRTTEETERVYVTRCIPRKARLDLIYRRNRSLRLDLWILWQTLRRVAGGGATTLSCRLRRAVRRNRGT